jgi:hypothetical protein
VTVSMDAASLVAACVACLVGLARADCPPGDLTGDCQVDAVDLQILAEQWLAGPNASADLGGDFPDGFDPWPVGPNGLGSSLSRWLADRYGNDPNNWEAAIPSPGRPND